MLFHMRSVQGSVLELQLLLMRRRKEKCWKLGWACCFLVFFFFFWSTRKTNGVSEMSWFQLQYAAVSVHSLLCLAVFLLKFSDYTSEHKLPKPGAQGCWLCLSKVLWGWMHGSEPGAVGTMGAPTSQLPEGASRPCCAESPWAPSSASLNKTTWNPWVFGLCKCEVMMAIGKRNWRL